MLAELSLLRPIVRYVPFGLCIVIAVIAVVLMFDEGGFFWLFLIAAVLSAVGVFDHIQTKHNLMRNYPVSRRLHWALEAIRPQIRQYFIESNIDGAPFDRNQRTLVYERAKNLHSEEPFGTENDVYQLGR